MQASRFIGCGLAVAALFAAFAPVASLAAAPVNLGNVPPPGTRYTVETTTDGSRQTTINGRLGMKRTTGTTHLHRAATVEVLTVRDGALTSVRVTYGNDCQAVYDATGDFASHKQTPFVYAGKTVTVMLGNDGEVTDDAVLMANPPDINELHSVLKNAFGRLPKKPVDIGEEWACDPDIAAQVLGLTGTGDTGEMKMKLLSVKEVSGRPTAEIQVTTTSTTHSGGAENKAQGQGTSLYDIATGVLLKSEHRVSYSGSGGDPAVMQTESTGTETTVVTAQLFPSATAPPAALIAPAPAAGVPAGNPLSAVPSYDGSFSDGKLTVDLSASGGAYAGTFTLGEQKFPATAHAGDQGLVGSFTAGARQFPFTAALDGNTLTLTSGNKTYSLKKATNPLDASPATAPPPAPIAAAPAAPPAGVTLGAFSELGSNDFGKTLFAEFSGSPSFEGAVSQARKALGGIFDAKPYCTGGLADAARKTGAADFTATLKGKAQRGWMMVGIDKGGTSVIIIYCQTDAPPAALADLFAAVPGKAKTTQFQFPDGSGSIELVRNWVAQSQNCRQNMLVTGPALQLLSGDVNFYLLAPDADQVKAAKRLYDLKVRNIQQSNQMNARFHLTPLPMPPPLDLKKQFSWATFCPVCRTTDDIARDFLPLIAERQERERYDLKVIDTAPFETESLRPGATAVVFTLSFSWKSDANVVPMRSLTKVEWFPGMTGKDQWEANVSEMVAPEATFARDVALMNVMRASVKPDDAWFMRQTRQILANGEKVTQTIIQTTKEQQENFEQTMKTQARLHEQYMQASEEHFQHSQENFWAQRAATTAASRDVTEFALGLRDVYDTHTGTYQKVDLFNSTAIVAGMNASSNDPHQYIEVPLRNEP